MALDPSISLQAGKIPQSQGTLGGIERGMKLQQLSMQPALLEQQLATARQAEQTSRAAQMTSEAQLPGVQAEAAIKVKEAALAAAKVKSAQEAFDFDDKGDPILDPVTKQPKFNTAKYQYGLYRSGNFDEGLKVGSDTLSQSKNAYDFLSTARTQAALAAQGAYDRTPGTPQQKQKAAEAMFNDMANRSISSAASIGFTISPDQLRYTPGLEKALYNAAINPQAQESLKQGLSGQDIQRDQLALQVNQFENSKKVNFTDDASLDPNSPVSIMSRQIARNAGLQVDDTMSAGDLSRNELTRGALSSIGSAAGAAKKEADKVVNQYESASRALENAKDVLAKNKITPLNLLQNKFNTKLLDDPKLLALYGQIQQLPDKSVINEGMDYNAVKAVLDGLSVNAKANAVSAVGGSPAKPTAPTTPNAANVVKIKSNEEYRALPSGTVFTGPDGIRRTKP